MALKSSSSAALFLSLNLLFFSLVTASSGNCNCGNPKRSPPSSRFPSPPSSRFPPIRGNPSCPRDTLKLAVCADLLNGLVHLVIGTPSNRPCCSLLNGLADLDAAVCLCTAIKANVLGINLNIPLSLSLLLNTCGRNLPRGFQCA